MRTGSVVVASVLGVLAVLAIACGSSRPASTPLPVTGSPEAACAPARQHESGSFQEGLTSAGEERQYLLYVPSSYSGVDTVPLVLNLHGFSSNALQQQIYSGLPAKAEEEGFIVVTPQGSGAIVLSYWDLRTSERAEGGDVTFLRDLLDAVESQLCVDTDRVYVTGMSNGAMMSVRLACDLSDRVAAIAPVAGVYFPVRCSSTQPVPVIAFHGTEDPVVPFEGGGIESRFGELGKPIEESVEDWAQHNGCIGSVDDEAVAEQIRRLRYGDCDQDATVELYVIEGGGHTWPGAVLDIPLGVTTQEISATDLMWAFFEEHPRVPAE